MGEGRGAARPRCGGREEKDSGGAGSRGPARRGGKRWSRPAPRGVPRLGPPLEPPGEETGIAGTTRDRALTHPPLEGQLEVSLQPHLEQDAVPGISLQLFL